MHLKLKKVGQTEPDVQEQLFGNLEQLHQKTMFITEAGRSIWVRRRRRRRR
jgi:hypothetical protein